jgi:flagellar biosynthesis chaperone FliJ
LGVFDLPPYPLQQVLGIKKKRIEEAEKNVREKQKALEAEQLKLKEREAERDKVKKHYQDKLQQLRDEFDQGTTSDKIDQIKKYLKVVQERLAAEEKKVKDQQQQVDLAEKNLQLAKQQLKEREKELDKIETHKKEWIKETKKELQVLETREEDELGSTMFLSKMILSKREAKKEQKENI